jgi:hypothetical protein
LLRTAGATVLLEKSGVNATHEGKWSSFFTPSTWAAWLLATCRHATGQLAADRHLQDV